PFATVPLPAAQPIEVLERQSRIAGRVTAIFARLLGKEPTGLEATSRFLELGADSLLLMQASRAIESEFGVRVPFRQLLDGLATIQELSAHLLREAHTDVDISRVSSSNSPDSRAEAPKAAPSQPVPV